MWKQLWKRSPLFVALTALTASCAGNVPPPPEPIDSESAAVAIALKMRSKLGPIVTETYKPDAVLFVQLDAEEGLDSLLVKEELIPSTLVDDEYAYLLNAAPGTYAAVAAVYGEDVEPVGVPVTSGNVGSNTNVSIGLSLFGGDSTTRNYFSEDIIRETVVTVHPGEVVFVGEFVTDQSSHFGDGDEAQVHFRRVVEGEDAGSGLLSGLFSSDSSLRLSLHEIKRDDKARSKFCKKARQRLKESAWISLVERLDEPR